MLIAITYALGSALSLWLLLFNPFLRCAEKSS